MATERFIIIVQERGIRTVRRNMRGLSQEARGAGSSVDFLKRALVGVGAVLSGRQVIEYANAFRTVQNRLRFVTDSTDQARVVQERLLEVANRSRVDFLSTSESYARLAFAGRNLGRSQLELLQVTETLNKAILLSGTRTQEAKNALIQLSQGLASNTLRGDELRAVLEQLPFVAQLIADSLGVALGDIRKLGSEGKLSAEVIVRALEDAAEDVDAAFENVQFTIGQGFTVLRNEFVALIGQVDEAGGFSDRLARLLILLAENLETVARALAGTAVAFIVFQNSANAARLTLTGFRRAVIAIIRVLPVLRIALLGTFGIVGALVSLGIGALVAFGDQIKLRQNDVASFHDFARTAFQNLAEEIRRVFAGQNVSINAFLANLETSITAALNSLTGLNLAYDFSLETLLLTAARTADQVASAFIASAALIVRAFEFVVVEIVEIFKRATDAAERGAANTLAAVLRVFGRKEEANTIDFLLGSTQPQLDTSAQRLNNFIQDVKNLFNAGFQTQDVVGPVEQFFLDAIDQARSGAVRQKIEEAREELRRALALARLGEAPPPGIQPDTGSGRRQTTFEDLLRAANRENELLRMGNEQRALAVELDKARKDLGRDLTTFELALLGGLIQQNMILDRQNRLVDEIKGPRAEILQKVNDLNVLYDQGRISAEEYATALRFFRVEITALDNSLGGGIQNALARLAEQANFAAQQFSDVLVNAVGEATQAIIDFANTGELKLAELGDRIAQLFLEFAIRQLIAKAVGGLSLGGFQHGGSFRVGGQGGPDSQLVAFRASPNERVTVTPPGQQSAAPLTPVVAPAPNVTVVNVQDPREIQAAIAAPEGEEVILNILNKNRQAIRGLLAG